MIMLVLCWLFYIIIIPGACGGLIASLSRTKRAARFFRAILTALCLEAVLVFILHANPIIRFDRASLSPDAAEKVAAYARAQGLDADNFGGADIGKYSVTVYYRLSVLSTDGDVIVGDIQLKAFPFGERHVLFYYVPGEDMALSYEEYQNL
jgi:hypothetical protein